MLDTEVRHCDAAQACRGTLDNNNNNPHLVLFWA